MIYWLPLVYAAALLGVSVLGSMYGLTGRDLAGVIVATSAAYCVWLGLYLLPVARRATKKAVTDGFGNTDAD